MEFSKYNDSKNHLTLFIVEVEDSIFNFFFINYLIQVRLQYSRTKEKD